MREFKYRGWINIEADHGGQEMGVVCEVNEKTYTIGLYNHGDFAMSDVVLMQSTGLEDVNGLDVYVGDIVRAKGRLGHEVFGRVIYNDYNLTYDVVEDSTFKGPALSNLYEIEVIGNVYEDSGLLGESND